MNRAVRNYLSTGMIALASGLLLGCLPEDDFQDLEVMSPSPKVSLPLLNTNLTLSNLINTDGDKNSLVENTDKSYSLRYTKHLESPAVAKFLPPIPDQNYSRSFSLGYDAPGVYSDSVTANYQATIPLNLNNLAIYKLETKTGNLSFGITSTYEHDVKVKLTFPNIVDQQGNPLIEVFDLVAWNTYTVSRNISLTAYTVAIKDREISYKMAVTLYGGSGNPISATQGVKFDFGMNDVAFSYIEGSFADIEIPVKPDTLLIPAFKSAISGDISLQPVLSMNFQNSFGTGIEADLSQVFVSSRNGQMTKLTDENGSKFFGGAFQVTAPAKRSEVASTKQKIDKNTSNIEDAFASIPDGILYDLGFVLTGTGNDTSYISADSKIGVDVKTEIPLEGRFEMMMADTMAVNFQNLSESMEELKVLIKTENSFPIDAYLQIHFMDENYKMLMDADGKPMSLFKGSEASDGQEAARFLHAAKITNTSTGETQVEKVDMPLAATISDRQVLDKAKYFLIRATVRSTDKANSIKLYSFYNIRFSMAMQMKTSL